MQTAGTCYLISLGNTLARYPLLAIVVDGAQAAREEGGGAAYAEASALKKQQMIEDVNNSGTAQYTFPQTLTHTRFTGEHWWMEHWGIPLLIISRYRGIFHCENHDV